MKRRTITLCLLTTMLLLASACQIDTASQLHAVYIFDSMKPSLPDRKTYHPGDQWILKFQRKRLPDSDKPTPASITITVQLLGPFTPEVADQNLRGGSLLTINGPVAVSQHIQTDDWTNTDAVMLFQLPKHLPPGSYDFVEAISTQGRSGARSREATGIPVVIL